MVVLCSKLSQLLRNNYCSVKNWNSTVTNVQVWVVVEHYNFMSIAFLCVRVVVLVILSIK